MNGKPKNHAACAAFVKAELAKLGADATVSSLPPLVPTGYEDLGLICPHGVRFYAEPTSEQIAEWVLGGVR